MIIGIIKEPEHENRVALTPVNIPELLQIGVSKVIVESGAGSRAYFKDEDFKAAGAIISNQEQILSDADLIIHINPFSKHQMSLINGEKTLIQQINPIKETAHVVPLIKAGLTSFSLDLLPRITRAQAMDVLSSMATVTGYKAAIMAANYLPSFFPMFMTAAGTIRPAKVLILGAGVAGLQAISTARRLGAVVEAFDVRSAAKEDVLSVGAKFVEVEGSKEDLSGGGYAIEQTEDYKEKQAALIHDHAIKSNVIICTAQIPGREAPLLIHRNTVEQMNARSVIIDLAAASGGNCEVTVNNQIIKHHGVTIIGDSNLASSIPYDASNMYGKNVTNFLKLLIKDGQCDFNFEDQIINDTCMIHKGEVRLTQLKENLEKIKQLNKSNA